MEYSRASGLRKRSLSDLITEKLLQETTTIPTTEGGRPTTTKDFSIGGAIKSSINEKLKSTATGIKEKFDPLNIAKVMTGGSKLAPALLGRLMGRSEEDIEYFTHKGSKQGKKRLAGKKDANYTTIGDGAAPKLRVGDSYSNVLAKMFLFLKKAQEHDKINYELEKNFREEQAQEDERRHNKLIDSILKKKKTKKASEVKDDEPAKEEDNFLDSILKGLTGTLASILKNLKDGVLWVADKLTTLVSSFVGSFTGGLAGSLTGAAIARMLGASKLALGILSSALLPILALALAKHWAENADLNDKNSLNPFTLIGRKALGAQGMNPEQMEEYRAKQYQTVPEEDMKGGSIGPGYKARKEKIKKEIEDGRGNYSVEDAKRIKIAYGIDVPKEMIQQALPTKEVGDKIRPKASNESIDAAITSLENQLKTTKDPKQQEAIKNNIQILKSQKQSDNVKSAPIKKNKISPSDKKSSGLTTTQSDTSDRLALIPPTPTSLPVQMSDESGAGNNSNQPVIAQSNTSVVGQNKSNFALVNLPVRNPEKSLRKTTYDSVVTV